MINLLAFSPVMVLLLGALATFPARRFLRIRPFVPAVTILAAGLLLVLNARQPGAMQFLLARPSPDPELDLTFEFNAVSLFFSGLLMVSWLAQVLVEDLRPGTRRDASSLVVLAGAVTFFCANNWTTLALGWLLTDLGLLASRSKFLKKSASRVFVWRAFGLSQFGLILFLAAGVLLVGSTISLQLSQVALDGFAATLVILGAWVRSGLYPFHYATPSEPDSPSGDSLRGLALTSLLGLYVLARALLRLQDAPANPEILQFLALLGIGATALLVLTETAPASRLAWAARAVGAPVFLSALVAVSVRASFVIWLALGLFNFVALVLGAGLLRAQTERQPWAQLLWGAAILCAAGFPLTPAFMGRVGLYAAAIQAGDTGMLAALPAAITLALIPLWKAFLSAGKFHGRKATPVELLGITLLLVPMLAEGLFSINLIGFFGRDVQDAGAFAYDALFRAPNILQPLFLVALVILPPILSFFLARALEPLRVRFGSAAHSVTPVLDLSAFVRLVTGFFESFGSLVRQVEGLIESYPVGWVLFVAIWVALWLLNAR